MVTQTEERILTDEEIEQKKIVDTIKNSFLKKYLEIETVTDIGFNGTKVWIKDNKLGDYEPVNQPSREEVFAFGKAISNYRSGEFTVTDPILDTEASYYRINLVNPVISPSGTTLALRMSRPHFVTDNIADFANDDAAELLAVLVQANTNMLISGITGTGKTELQKLLVKYMQGKILIIEDTMDSHIKELYPEKNILSWRTLTHRSRENKIDYHDCIHAGVRNDVDWMIPAETRSSTAYNVAEAALTGHNLLTTLHAKSAALIISRMLSLMGETRNINEMRMGKDLVETFPIGIHLVAEKTPLGIKRFIKEIVEFTDFDGRETAYTSLYKVSREKVEGKDEYLESCFTDKLSEKLKAQLEFNKLIHLIPECFI